TRCLSDWSSDVCSSDLTKGKGGPDCSGPPFGCRLPICPAAKPSYWFTSFTSTMGSPPGFGALGEAQVPFAVRLSVEIDQRSRVRSEERRVGKVCRCGRC